MAITGRWPVLPSKCRNGNASEPPMVTAEVRVPVPPRVTARMAWAVFSSGTLKPEGMTMRAEVIGFGGGGAATGLAAFAGASQHGAVFVLAGGAAAGGICGGAAGERRRPLYISSMLGP